MSTVESVTPADSSASVRSQLADLRIDLICRVRAAYQVLYIQTAELLQAETLLRSVAIDMTKTEREPKFLNNMMVCWDPVRGFYSYIGLLEGINHVPTEFQDAKYRNPSEALDAIIPVPQTAANASKNFPKRCLFVFHDLDDFMKNPLIRQKLCYLAARQRLTMEGYRHPLFIVSANVDLDMKARPYISVSSLPLPDAPTFKELADRLQETALQASTGAAADITTFTPARRDAVVDNLAGLTYLEAENVLARCITQFKSLGHEKVIPTLMTEKAAVVKKSEVLTFIPPSQITDMDDLCGFDAYLAWLRRRKLSYSSAAKEHQIDPPRGVAVLGIPGTGKSQLAKATCVELGLPGYSMDIGAVFGSLVGESEARLRAALKILDAQNGCVLVLDEIDKALGNAHQSSGDSGVTRRIFGALLTWLAENTSRTFVIATLNRTDGIPPEMLRAGRFDKMFYTDLPTTEARRSILTVHLRKRGVDIAQLGLTDEFWRQFDEISDAFVGSELEEAVKESRHIAMAENGNGVPTMPQLLRSITSINPMAKTEKETIQQMQAFCSAKATPVTGYASEPIAVAPVTAGSPRVRRRSIDN